MDDIQTIYSGTPLIWTPFGQKKVALFQGLNYIFGERKGVLIRDSNYDYIQ